MWDKRLKQIISNDLYDIPRIISRYIPKKKSIIKAELRVGIKSLHIENRIPN